MHKRLALVVALVAVAAATLASAASASPRMLKGVYDEGQTLYGNPDTAYPVLEQLGAKVVRINLYWGGRWGASRARPTPGWIDPDEAGKFNWGIYDRAVLYAGQHKMKVVFSIYGTPSWANRNKGMNVPPTDFNDLRRFAQIAAQRYSGFYTNNEGRILPPVRHWIAWNEPNNPVFLKDQWRKVGGKWVIQSGRDYAKICNAIVQGVGAADIAPAKEGQRVACGVTAPRGNNSPPSLRNKRPSVSPLAFMRSMKTNGARGFDAYAHHPYPGHPSETPTTRPKQGATSITFGNLDVLLKELTRLYGARMPLWITEYGYETKPHDRIFGVTPALQARYLTQAFTAAKRHPRIDMMLWFMLRDERRARAGDGWQSGLITSTGQRKPAFNAFRAVR